MIVGGELDHLLGDLMGRMSQQRLQHDPRGGIGIFILKLDPNVLAAALNDSSVTVMLVAGGP